MRDPLTWLVLYPDGATLAEYDPEVGEHGWAEVRAAEVALIALQDEVGRMVVMVEVPAEHTAVFFRRRSITITTDGTEVGSRSSATCMGWDGAFLWIYADGSIALRTTKD